MSADLSILKLITQATIVVQLVMLLLAAASVYSWTIIFQKLQIRGDAPTIKAAEAAKVIENTQRDLNIALMNELAIIFDKIGIDTTEVLEAAGTKWNFLPFRPGLVGGHCIGVDPYYLTHKAEKLGYNPQVILAGRRINDGMGKFIAEQTIKHMIAAGSTITRDVAPDALALTRAPLTVREGWAARRRAAQKPRSS